MNVKEHDISGSRVAELVSDEVKIITVQDGLELLGNLYYQGYDTIIIPESAIAPDFFDLKNGKAGELFQKFSNYRVRLVLIGDYSKYSSKSLNDFIHESNKGKQVNFMGSLSEAITLLMVK